MKFKKQNSDNYVLKDISIEFKSNELIGFVGTTGSGKTSFLMSLLGEMGYSKGEINMNGSIFYVSQEPWIFPGSIKQNIIFGKPFDEDRFNECIEMCALNEDLKAMDNREETLIGDKGVNLSGGQRARISLARALYYDAQIYLLDDPLSAVDAHVAQYLYNT